MLLYSNKAIKSRLFHVAKYFSKLYTKSHEWVELDKDIATIGITDYAQNELGEIVHVDLPKIGEKFKQNESLVLI
jgi:glycine cleavage system H protein